MESCRNRFALLFAAVLLLALWGCSGGPEDRPVSENKITIAASFHWETGDSLGDGSVRLSAGGEPDDYPMGGGEAELSGLPRQGSATLTLLDSQGIVLGTIRLSISPGAVIDATVDETGCAHITLREDTERVAVAFVLKPGGAVSCALQLAQAEPPGQA